MTTNITTMDGGSLRSNSLLTALSRAADAFQRARAERRTERALAELEDHVLLDIGINPGDVRRRERAATDWIMLSRSGTARLVFFGR